MGIGFALGGVAKGLESAEQSLAQNRALDLREQTIQQDKALRERALGIQQQQVDQNALNAQFERAGEFVKDHLETIKSIAESDNPVEAKRKVIAPLLDDIDGLDAQVKGLGGNLNVGGIRNRVDASLSVPAGSDPVFEGTGMQQQSSNILMDISRKISEGLPVTAQDRRAYALAYGEITAPKVVGSPSTGFSIVQPQLDPNVFPPPDQLGAARESQTTPTQTQQAPQVGADTATQQAPGASVTSLSGPTKPQTAEQAGRGALVSEGMKNIQSVRDSVVNVDGTINRDTIFTMSTDIPLLGKGLPFSEGRGVRAIMEDAASSKLRLETGAQANAEEIQGIIDRFMPSNFDDDKTVRDKMNRMVSFFEAALEKSDPALFKKLTGRAQAEGNIPDPPEGEEDAEFRGFDGSSGAAIFKRKDGTFFGIVQDGD